MQLLGHRAVEGTVEAAGRGVRTGLGPTPPPHGRAALASPRLSL